jgi:type VI secretion system protein ImpJ
MKLIKPMRWKEGMFLRPQHFQQYDLYLENREFSRFQSLESFGWGLLRLEIDKEALGNFVFDVKQLTAVLPEGAIVDVPGNSRIGRRPFDALMKEVGRPMNVSVGVRARDTRGPLTVPAGEGSGEARFVAAEEEAYDLDAGRDPAPLEKLTYNLRIFMGNEPTDGYEVVPVARLVRTGDPARPVETSADFSPPALMLSAASGLHDDARAVVEKLTTTLRDLGQKRGGNDPDPLILYYGLAGSLPVLKEMVQEGRVHPRAVYHELARLAGALFYRDKQGRSAEQIPPYDHYEPAKVFRSLRELIFELSEIVVERAFRICPMERDADLFKVVLPAEAKSPGAGFYLDIHAVDSLQKVDVMLMTARSSNPGRIDFLRANALPGVATESQPGPPQQLQGQPDLGKFFRLKHEEPEWSTHVTPAGELAVFLMNCPDDVSIRLVVVLAGG